MIVVYISFDKETVTETKLTECDHKGIQMIEVPIEFFLSSNLTKYKLSKIQRLDQGLNPDHLL